eukprot:6456179-Amphidinium_carterae.1
MYGSRDAAASWENYYKTAFEKAEVRHPCVFAGRGTQCWIHGDDILSCCSNTQYAKRATN